MVASTWSTLQEVVVPNLPPIMGLTEVANYAGVSRQLAKKWTATWGDWPAPYAVLAAGNIWQTDDVKDVLKRHERTPGAGPRAVGDPRPPSVAQKVAEPVAEPAATPKRRRARVVK
jgi:hypothetical protein